MHTNRTVTVAAVCCCRCRPHLRFGHRHLFTCNFGHSTGWLAGWRAGWRVCNCSHKKDKHAQELERQVHERVLFFSWLCGLVLDAGPYWSTVGAKR